MSGHADPPEGTPEGVPSGGEDEYGSVVFDESFVRAARIREFSAQERLDDAAHAVRVRHVLPHGMARQAIAMVSLIVVAFGFAVYMGLRHPYATHHAASAVQLRTTVIPLVPTGPVPAVSGSSPFAGSRAAHYRTGAAGFGVPRAREVGGFAQSEVAEALDTAEDYLKESSLDARTVLDGDVGAVRDLLAPGQLDQFDDSLGRPDADGSHEATGWLVRFDPAADVRLVGGGIRVSGSFDDPAAAGGELEIGSDHTFVYALRGIGSADTGVSLFTVRRQLRFRFDHADLRQHRIELVEAQVQAGPLACTSTVDGYFRPILAGGSAGPVTGADPYDRERSAGSVCAALATGGTSASSAASATPSPEATTSPQAGTGGATTGVTAGAAAGTAGTATAPSAGSSPAPTGPWGRIGVVAPETATRTLADAAPPAAPAAAKASATAGPSASATLRAPARVPTPASRTAAQSR